MKQFYLFMLALLSCIAAKAQICDLTYMFHVGMEPAAATLHYCSGDSKNTFWMGNIDDTFIFDDDGNLKSHNGKLYTDFVRDDDGVLKEVTCDDFRYKFDITSTKIVVETYRLRDMNFFWKEEYFLNKDGYVAKKVTTYDDGDQNIKTYSYVEKSLGNWYIRKMTEKNKYGTQKNYQCLKVY